ncbi:MAG: AzlD domain-containing protein [Desulfobacterales bacterium]|nr:AzlD domain-containing protein [Desulfobacterales bacterium]MDX2509324.1 AzlD domain-containing protein [Desulfobacterales bacterium]
METVYLITGMFFVTFSIRYGLLPLSGRIRFSPSVQRALSYVPPAVLTAIIVPMALIPDGQTLQVSIANPYLVGTVFTVLIGWFSKNLMVTIVGGMAVFGMCQWVLTLF